MLSSVLKLGTQGQVDDYNDTDDDDEDDDDNDEDNQPGQDSGTEAQALDTKPQILGHRNRDPS